MGTLGGSGGGSCFPFLRRDDKDGNLMSDKLVKAFRRPVLSRSSVEAVDAVDADIAIEVSSVGQL